MRRLSGVAAMAAMMMTASCGWVDAGVDGNKPPAVASTVTGDYTVDEGGVLEVAPDKGLLTNVSDGGNNPPEVRVVSEPAHGTLRLTGEGGFVYEHDGSEAQSDTFSYVANDGIEDSEPVTVTIGIAAVNDPPVIVGAPEDLTVEEDGVLELSVDQFDIADEDNTDTGDFKLIVHPGADYRADGVLVQPARDYGGALTVGVSVTDGSATSETVQLAVDVTPVNDPPVIVSQTAPLQTEEDVALVLPVDAFDISDVDDDSGDLALVALAGSGYSVDGLRITPEPNFNGALTVNVAARDKETAGETFAAVVEVLPVDDPPVLVTPIGNPTATEDQPFTLDLTTFFDEPDGDMLTYSQKGLPPSLVLDKAAGAISGTPQYTEGGRSYKVTITAADSGGLKVEAGFLLDVDNVNRRPVTTGIKDTLIDEGAEDVWRLNEVFSDPDGDPLAYTVEGPDWITIGSDDVMRTRQGFDVEDAGRTYKEQVTVRADDGRQSVTATFDLIVNRPPYIDDMANLSVSENEPIDLTFEYGDPDGDTIFPPSVVVDPDGDTHSLSVAGELKPDGSSYQGSVQGTLEEDTWVTVTVSDGRMNASDGFRVEVHKLPVAEDGCWDVRQEEELTGNLGSDRHREDEYESDKPEYSFVGSDDCEYGPTATLDTAKGAKVTLNCDTGDFTYTPAEQGGRGMDFFRFKVANMAGEDEGTAQVVVHQKIMPLGDSVTLGMTDVATKKPALEERVGYRERLYMDLEADGYAIDMVGSNSGGTMPDPDYEGCIGVTASHIADLFYWLKSGVPSEPPSTECPVQDQDEYAADFILLQVGTDSLAETSSSDIEVILDLIDDWENSVGPVTVLVATLPGSDPAVDVFNNTLSSLVAARKHDDVVLVDQNAALTDPEYYASDGLHPSQIGYEKMADTWALHLKGRGEGRGLDKCP